ncbi:hypothetical protein F2Q68_00040171 [Brassica cretica]|uniref:DNA2/NAM7 helicase-like C-terminal domain-containing protein n=1 Tax=Brassica cretica TaxID=69181 RepID=A0A8S9ML55_BRACR|nr:hypothetical protein F2Q68_00040171 [Brassica cretica]
MVDLSTTRSLLVVIDLDVTTRCHLGNKSYSSRTCHLSRVSPHGSRVSSSRQTCCGCDSRRLGFDLYIQPPLHDKDNQGEKQSQQALTTVISSCLVLSFELVESSTSSISRHISQHHHSLTSIHTNYLFGTRDLNTRLRVDNSSLGDPKQLPATVISKFAQYSGYGTSRFQRLQKVGYPVDMLKTQYCMRPERRSFPSKEFYQDALEDGADIELRQLLTDINTVALVCFSFSICMKGKSLNIRDKLVL